MVSIIIPTYNREGVLGFTIDSVLAQTYPDWECLLVDDGSTDRTLDIAENYCKSDSRIKLFLRDREPKNANTCRNIGLEKSRGDYILFLDSDDQLIPECLENRVNIANEHPKNDFWVFKSWEKIGDKIVPGNIFLQKENDLLAYFLQMKFPWGTASPLWKRSFIMELNGFDKNMLRFQDVELHIRALIYVKEGFFVDLNSKPDWYYTFRLYNSVDRHLNLLERMIDSSLYLYRKIAPLFSDTEYMPFVQRGLKKNFLDYVFNNALLNFKGQSLIDRFVEEISRTEILTFNEQRKMKTISRLPKFIYRIPGAYRTLKLFLK
jgi:glycosyltransferase involved in cell wall biosynthesis